MVAYTRFMFETSIAKLPVYSKRRRNHSDNGGCICCGKDIETPEWMVVTEQGCYPVGRECKAKVIKAGFEVEAS